MVRRKAFSLIEVVAAITVGTAMMAVCLGVLHLLFRMDREARDDLRNSAALLRLAEQFREDAHAADKIVPAAVAPGQPKQPAWEIGLAADRKVEYRQEAGRLLRTERSGKQVSNQESYRLPPGAGVSIEVQEEKSGKIAVLRIAPDRAEPEVVSHPVRIEAALGLFGVR